MRAFFLDLEQILKGVIMAYKKSKKTRITKGNTAYGKAAGVTDVLQTEMARKKKKKKAAYTGPKLKPTPTAKSPVLIPTPTATPPRIVVMK